MQVVTKRDAERVLTESLFKPINGKTLSRGRFDLGKYGPTPTELVGRDVPDVPGVHAVYGVRRSDRDGPYTALYSIHE